ncbi:cation-binding protein [Bacteroidia bacterium]|nr:cation-binding protein [Bacteroidia bacterium]
MNKFRFGKYRETDLLSDLITDDYAVLSVMGRMGIATGFGMKNIGEVCRDNQVDTNTFLAIVNLMTARTFDGYVSDTPVSIPALIAYLRHSHSYFLDYRLPQIRKKLQAVLSKDRQELNKAVLEYFDKFVAAVRKHMLYENNKVFPEKYRQDFRKQHESIETNLTEFKNVLIKYYPAPITDDFNSVLFDIFECERDLTFHNAVEDTFLLSAIES